MKNIKKKALAAATISGLTAAMTGVLSLTPIGSDEAVAQSGMEKCAGIARKAMNDCGANGHACGGLAAVDGDPNEWVYVPIGSCEKIVNGRLLKEGRGRAVKSNDKCYGIARKAKNDCGANGHACGGLAVVDGDPNEWIYLPKGICEKIVGASTSKP